MSNPVQGPYSPAASKYHVNPASYSRTINATATFIATGSNANPSAFYGPLGMSGATVTLTNGGTFSLPAAAAGSPAQVYELSVYSVDSGIVNLLYR